MDCMAIWNNMKQIFVEMWSHHFFNLVHNVEYLHMILERAISLTWIIAIIHDGTPPLTFSLQQSCNGSNVGRRSSDPLIHRIETKNGN